MKLTTLTVLPACLATVACQSGRLLDTGDALAAESIELQVTAAGNMGEIEYHIDPMAVPAAVRTAMDELHPGGAYTAAEKEVNDGVLYYELSRTAGGMEVEAMFTPDGRLHSEEVEVAGTAVPEVVRTTAMDARSGAMVTKWEEIRDGDRRVFEYHVKMTSGGKNWKVMVAPSGTLLAIYREIPAEIEVPVGD